MSMDSPDSWFKTVSGFWAKHVIVLGSRKADGTENTDSRGNPAVNTTSESIDPNRDIPKVIETRMISMRSANAGDAALGSSVLPVPIDGSSLVEWSGFTNSPKQAAFLSRNGTATENQTQFWAVVFNKTATQAAVVINAALNNSGLAFSRTSSAVSLANFDHSDVRLVPSDTGSRSYVIPLGIEITSMHVVPVTGSTSSINQSGAMMEVSLFA